MRDSVMPQSERQPGVDDVPETKQIRVGGHNHASPPPFDRVRLAVDQRRIEQKVSSTIERRKLPFVDGPHAAGESINDMLSRPADDFRQRPVLLLCDFIHDCERVRVTLHSLW